MIGEPPRPERLHAIDAIRGLALLVIFLNHVTLGALHELSPVKVMFSDSAEVFIFLAGTACFLAYAPRPGGRDMRAGTMRIWRRALTLFWVNLLIAGVSIAVLLAANALAPLPRAEFMPAHQIATNGLGTYLWHVVSMQETVGYSMVLRLYVCLFLLAPAYVWLASRRFWLPLVPAAAIWLVAGHFGLAESSSLSGVPLALTILPWNLVFAGGIAFGAAIAQGVRLQRSRGRDLTAIAVLATGPVCALLLSRWSPEAAEWIATRNEYFWTGASKSLQSPLRVAYMGALVYACVAFRHAPVIRLLHAAGPRSMLARLGRSSLEVFAAGAVMALALDQALWALRSYGLAPFRSPVSLAVELVLMGVAVTVMVFIADNPRWRFARIIPALDGPPRKSARLSAAG